MDNKNLHLRNKLRNEELPPEFTWDNVSPGILAEVMDTPTSDNRVIKTLYIITSLLFAIGLAILFLVPSPTNEIQLNNTSSKKQKQSIIIAANSESGKRAKKTTNDNTSAPTTIDLVKSDSDGSAYEIEQKENLASLNQVESNTTKAKQTALTELAKEEAIRPTKQQLYQAPTSFNNNIIAQKLVTETQTTIEKTEDRRSQTAETSYLQNDKTRLAIESSPLSSLASKLSPIEHHREVPVITAGTNNSEIIVHRKQSRFSIELGAGTNFLQHNYHGSDLAELKQASKNSALGQSLNIGLRYELAPIWSISSGLSYQSLVNKLDYYNTWDSTVLAVKKIIEVNSLTGESSEYYTETTAQTTAYDSVIHYNIIKVLSLPIIINRSWVSYQGLCLETSLGLNYGITTRSNGKHIIETSSESKEYQVVQYSDKHYTSRANALAGISLKYPLGNRCYLMGSLTGSYALSSWANINTYSNQPLIWDAGLKFGFKL